MALSFHNEKISFEYREKKRCEIWIKRILEEAEFTTGDLSIIFTSNSEIQEINQKFLNHNYTTDVITFDYSEGSTISGDVFISIEEVEENSRFFKQPFDEELQRVIIHGILHLMGGDDKEEEGRMRMRNLEEEALNLWFKTGK